MRSINGVVRRSIPGRGTCCISADPESAVYRLDCKSFNRTIDIRFITLSLKGRIGDFNFSRVFSSRAKYATEPRKGRYSINIHSGLDRCSRLSSMIIPCNYRKRVDRARRTKCRCPVGNVCSINDIIGGRIIGRSHVCIITDFECPACECFDYKGINSTVGVSFVSSSLELIQSYCNRSYIVRASNCTIKSIQCRNSINTLKSVRNREIEVVVSRISCAVGSCPYDISCSVRPNQECIITALTISTIIVSGNN